MGRGRLGGLVHSLQGEGQVKAQDSGGGECLIELMFDVYTTRMYDPLPGPSSNSCKGFWPLAEVLLLPLKQKNTIFSFFLLGGGRLKQMF